jgi:hypothetical protein
MPASLTIEGQLYLDEMELGPELTVGEPVAMRVRNDGDTVIRDVVVDVDGGEAKLVQLAVDDDGPAVWAAVGESVVLAGELMPGDARTVWARGCFGPDDVEGEYDLNLRARGKSVRAAMQDNTGDDTGA